MSKRVSLTAMFIAFAVILSYVESFIPVIGIPGAKLGLANLAIIIVLYLEGIKEAAICNCIRILIIGAMFGNLFSILFAMAGAFISLTIMYILKKTDRFSIITVSICGGVFHNIGQLIVASFVVETYSVIVYLPVLILLGSITGSFIGILSGNVLNKISKFYESKGER